MADEEINEYAEHEPADTGKFFKFKDGHEHKIRIFTPTAVYENVFTDKTTGKQNISGKYAWGIYDLETRMVKMLQSGVMLYKEIAKFGKNAEYGDPRNYNLAITRTGTGFETEFTVVASPNKSILAEIAPDSVAKVAEFDLIKELKSSADNSKVFWLADAVRAQKSGTPLATQHGVLEAAKTADELVPPAETTVEDDLHDGKPIELSEIPF